MKATAALIAIAGIALSTNAAIALDFGPTERGYYDDNWSFHAYSKSHPVDIRTWVRALNNQVAHLIYDGRTKDDDLKIGDQVRIDMINALSKEVEIFKKELKFEYKSLPISSIPKFVLPASEAALRPGGPAREILIRQSGSTGAFRTAS